MSDRRAEKLERYLAYAFASADLLFQIDEDGRIAELLGAVLTLAGEASPRLIGKPWTQLIAAEDCDLALALMLGLSPGERRGPVRVQLRGADQGAGSRYVGLTLFRGVGAGQNVVGTLSSSAPELPRPGAPRRLVATETLQADLPRLLAQARDAGTRLNLDLIDASGLDDALNGIPKNARLKLESALAAYLKAGSFRGGSAVRLDPDRFALVSDRSNDALGGQLAELLKGFGLEVPVSCTSAPLPRDTNPDVAARAIKVAMETFIQRGAEAATLSLDEALQETVKRAEALRTSISAHRFKLLYQPIVDIATRAPHHYEALLRLDDKSSPFDAVRLAEDLGLVRDFDQSIAESVIDDLAAHGDKTLQVAVNVSAVSLLSESYVSSLVARLHAKKVAPRRLLVELTETVPITDYDLAQSRINQLRKSGIGFCLDDVGSGSAAFDHLRLLSFDYIKLDGRFAVGLLGSIRAKTIVRHLTKLGQELGGTVIAEHVEDEATLEVFASAGVELGQGWLFGRASALPLPPGERRARRLGVKDDWR